MKVKTILTLTLLTVVSLFTAGQVMAGQYGEVEITKDITLDKKVKNPNTDEWVDNLFSSDYKFAPEQKVDFKITLKNVGNKELDQVEYRDTLPEYLNYYSGDTGVTIYDFDVDETQTFYFTARVDNEAELPNDWSLYCGPKSTNKAYAWIEGGESEEDTSQICVKQDIVAPVQELKPAILPKAGPADNLYILLGSAVFSLTGWALIKKS